MRTMLHWCLSATLLAAIGCGGGGNKPHTVPVEGKLTLDGAPLEGAMLQFQPVSGSGHVATGLSGKDGSFRLTTFNTGDGAAPGGYKIVVIKGAITPGDADNMDPSKMGKDYVNMMKATMVKPTTKPKGEVADSYQNSKTTPLKATVPDGGIKDLVVPLKKDGT